MSKFLFLKVFSWVFFFFFWSLEFTAKDALLWKVWSFSDGAALTECLVYAHIKLHGRGRLR